MKIERAWKILKPDLTTHNGCQWVPGKWKKVEGTGLLCSEGWLHGYRDARLAVVHNPIHANYDPCVLWIAEVKGKVLHEDYMKSGWSEMRLIEPVAVPAVTTEQRIRYAIKCAWLINNNPVWKKWAVDWIREENRSRQRAEQVWRAMWGETAAAEEVAAEEAAARAAAEAATKATRAAARATMAATWAAEAAEAAAAGAAGAAAWAATAAARAAEAAVAARWTTEARDLLQAVEWAMSDSKELR